MQVSEGYTRYIHFTGKAQTGMVMPRLISRQVPQINEMSLINLLFTDHRQPPPKPRPIVCLSKI